MVLTTCAKSLFLSFLFSPKMSNESESVMNAVVAPITYPIFYPRNPYVRFRQLENTFQLLGISSQKTMFQNAFSACSTNVATQVIDIVNKAPEDNFYAPLILKKNVSNNCSRKLNLGIALLSNSSVTCDPSWAKLG
ncbi:hypothetical protein ACTXT7_011770 [Hymenolepis weldensis]